MTFDDRVGEMAIYRRLLYNIRTTAVALVGRPNPPHGASELHRLERLSRLNR